MKYVDAHRVAVPLGYSGQAALQCSNNISTNVYVTLWQSSCTFLLFDFGKLILRRDEMERLSAAGGEVSGGTIRYEKLAPDTIYWDTAVLRWYEACDERHSIPSDDDDDDKPPKCLSTCFSSYAHLNQSLSAVLWQMSSTFLLIFLLACLCVYVCVCLNNTQLNYHNIIQILLYPLPSPPLVSLPAPPAVTRSVGRSESV